MTRFSRKKCSRIIQARRASSGSIQNIGTVVRSHVFYTTDDFYATAVCFYGSSLNIRGASVTISGKFPNKQKKEKTMTDTRGAQRRCDKMSHQLKRFYIFNCDNTYKLEIVENFLLQVEEKYGFKISIDRLNFGLQRMVEVCENTLPKLVMDVAVFVVHANESRLSINEDNAGIGYARFYRALLQKTGGFQYKVLPLPLILPLNTHTGDWQFFLSADLVKVSRMKKIVGNFTKTYLA